MKILIVYEEVPETTKFYTVEVTDSEWEWMRLTHGYYVNAKAPKKNEAACLKLMNWLEDETPLTFDTPIGVAGIEYVLHTGFIL